LSSGRKKNWEGEYELTVENITAGEMNICSCRIDKVEEKNPSKQRGEDGYFLFFSLMSFFSFF
jgi:hypothetical protein